MIRSNLAPQTGPKCILDLGNYCYSTKEKGKGEKGEKKGVRGENGKMMIERERSKGYVNEAKGWKKGEAKRVEVWGSKDVR